MIDLPNPTRPALASFWIVSSMAAGSAVVLVTWILLIRYPVVWGLVAGSILCLPGILRPALVGRPYEAWNRLSRLARRAARMWITGVAFLIIAVVGRSGGRMAWNATGDGASGWTPKRPLPPGSHRATSDVAVAPGVERGWIHALASWAGRSGNVWAWSLVPALVLLKAVERQPSGSLGGNVYTLY